MSKNLKSSAMKYCSNWDCGVCLGAMFRRDEDGKLHTYMDEEYHNKECKVNDGCDYFDNVVVPGIEEK
jgi:hypothetical protein